jgi:hypothetical protein
MLLLGLSHKKEMQEGGLVDKSPANLCPILEGPGLNIIFQEWEVIFLSDKFPL